jgi:hypothetical protein
MEALQSITTARLRAGPIAIKLAEETSKLVAALDIKGTCMVGLIKGEPRVIFKSIMKYGGNTSKCRDLARATVCVQTLAHIVAVVNAVFLCPWIIVIRTKNRMAATYDAIPVGGYRDVQLLCLVQGEDGTWQYAEAHTAVHTKVSKKFSIEGNRRFFASLPHIIKNLMFSESMENIHFQQTCSLAPGPSRNLILSQSAKKYTTPTEQNYYTGFDQTRFKTHFGRAYNICLCVSKTE